MAESEDKLKRRLMDRMDDLFWALSRAHMAEFVELFRRPRRMIWLSFLSGLARGLGTLVGFSILGALVLYILTLSLVRNLPLVGGVIAELIVIINEHLGNP